jgi:regulator of replication initiation timing
MMATPDDVVRALTAERDALRVERDQLRATLDRMHRQKVAAIRAWRAANPGNDLVWPDQSRLIAWCLAEVARLRAEVASLRLTLGNQTLDSDVPDPIGCPLPGACVQVAEIKRLRATLDLIRQDAWTHPQDWETDRRVRLERIADRIRDLSEVSANGF